MRYTPDVLYRLLPSPYRVLDQNELSPEEDRLVLYGLMQALGREIGIVEEDIDQLYDDLFIETCAPWVVPYIGDLIGYKPLIPIPDQAISERTQVAQQIALRRRKGTLAVLEELARTTTGKTTRAVEFFKLLVVYSNLNHLSRTTGRADVRNVLALRAIGTPFESIPHRGDIRSVEVGDVGYNITNIGLYVWRTEHLRITRATAFQLVGRRFSFSPFGKAMQLYNEPLSEQGIDQLAGPINTPSALDRRVLYDATEELRRRKALGMADYQKASPYFYGHADALEVWLNGAKVPPEEILIAQLLRSGTDPATGVWETAPCDKKDYKDAANATVSLPIKVAVDPFLGLLWVSGAGVINSLEVSYTTLKPMAYGGGPYDRQDTFTVLPPGTKLVKVSRSATFTTIDAAITDLAGQSGIIEIEDSRTYTQAFNLNFTAGATIEIRAANGATPVLRPAAGCSIQGAADARLSLNGLTIDATVNMAGAFTSIAVRHCTLVPVAGRASVTFANPAQLGGLQMSLEDSVSGVITLPTPTAKFNAIRSVLDSSGTVTPTVGVVLAPSVEGPVLNLQDCTVFGSLFCHEIDLVSNSIVTGALRARRLQVGCVRYSHLGPGSQTPKPFECVPKLPADALKAKPLFKSKQFGSVDYCRLARYCPNAVKEGADDQGEMGVFHSLYIPLRNRNLRVRLDESLRLGLSAGLIDAFLEKRKP